MARPRTRDEKLFGAACLKLTLVGASDTTVSEIYLGALADLDLTEADVDAYLKEHRADVEARLAQTRRS